MTQGYGSLEYEFVGFKKAKVVKMIIHIMDDPIDALSFLIADERAFELGKEVCKKLKESIPSHLFVVSI